MGTPVRSGSGDGPIKRRKRRPDGTFEQLICTYTECGRVYEYEPRRGHSRQRCNSCRQNSRDSRIGVKQRLVDARGGCCQLCGYDACIDVLTFHHVDPELKSFQLSMSNAQRSLPLLLREARKCVVLCANCHREVHAGVRTIPDVIAAEILAEFADEPRKPWKNGRPATPIVPR